MVLRNMKPADYPHLVSLWSGFDGTTMTAADSRDGFEKFLERNSDFCFTAIEGDKVIGSVMAGHDSRRGYIYHLAVDESVQGKGLGSSLMKAAEDALRLAGIEKAHLFIYIDNTAIEFYEKAGWHRRGDITIMSKVLIGEKNMGTRSME
jgi:N-acetylglutamate synthase